MTTQTEMFPKTELDEATLVLNHLIAEEEKAEKAADSAGQKAEDASMRVRKQRHVVARLQAMMPAVEPIMEEEATEDDIEDAEILQIEGDVLDPITGEVTSKSGVVTGPLAEGLEPVAEEMLAELAAEGVIVDDDVDVDELPDESTGGTRRLPDGGRYAPADPVVYVLYPGDKTEHPTEVGPFTKYSELVADYLATGSSEEDLGGDIMPDQWQVIGDDDCQPRTLSMDIPADDYGKRLIVEVAVDRVSAPDAD